MRLILAACVAAVAAQAATIAIRNLAVIDGTGSSPKPRQTILIRGDRIVAIGSAAAVRAPKGARIIDGSGKFAIPGLWDMHVHLWDKQNVLPEYVAHGITGVRDMGSDYARTKTWRAAAESGKAVGPRIVTCGPAVDGAPSNNPKLPVDVIRDPEQARREFDRLDDMHVDFIKILSTLPRDAYFALAERARHWDLPFAGHLPRDVTVEEAIEARQASLEHMFGFPVSDESRCREALVRCAMFGTRLTPSLTLWRRMADEDPTIREQLPRIDLLVKQAKEAGVSLLAGTDTGDPDTTPGVTLHQELALLVEAGLTPIEALQTATFEPARFLGWDSVLGTLRKGMLADLVLLDANPLADIRNVSKVAGVAVRGRYLTKVQLHALAATRSTAPSDRPSARAHDPRRKVRPATP